MFVSNGDDRIVMVTLLQQEWPISGGEWGTAACSYPEIILTG